MGHAKGSNVYSTVAEGAPAYVEVDPSDLGLMPSQIFRDEVKAIVRRREHLGVPRPTGSDFEKPTTDLGLTGLAISGGGIRSATFSLGVMQAFASRDVLKNVDYMSTVSGGGYIGSCLTWALYGQPQTEDREHLEFIETLGVGPESFPVGTDDPRDPAPADVDVKRLKLLKYLREHGKYLIPGGGITALSCLGVLLRGILLNLLVWVALVGCAIYFVRVYWRPDAFESLRAFVYLAVGGVAISVLYSLGTFVRFKGMNRYWTRRLFESGARPYLALLFLSVAVGTLGAAYDAAQGLVPVGGLSPAMIASGAGTGLWTYLRTASQKPGQASKIPIGLVATLGSLLLLYGALLGAYGLADLAFEKPSWHPHVWRAFGVTLVTGWFVNINQISLHRFYRDRLMEVFLPGIDRAIRGETGASPEADKAPISEMWDDANPRGPYHIINTNLVTVDSKLRTQHTRGGDNFILSPFYCGSTVTGWRRTEEFEGNAITLATAMAVSAAAANPNTGVGGKGVSRNKFVSLLMALLNLRLGYWTHRPKSSRKPLLSPNHFWPGGAYELAGLFREDRFWLQLTDGGHFENLAVYEMIRRRLKLIIVVDAGADPNFVFADLQTASRRIETDFGTVVDFSEDSEPGTLSYEKTTRDETERVVTSDVPRGGSSGFPSYDKRAKRGWIHGTIHYPGGETGDLIYLKTTMVDGLSLTTQGYKDNNPTFPDQTTADQFFDPEQFAAYRELGYVIGLQAAEKIAELIPATSPPWAAA